MPIDPRFRFSGAAATARQPRTDQVSVTSARRIVPGVARGGESTTEIDADAVLRVELENGFVLWSRADDLMHERGQRSVGRDGDALWRLDFGPRPGHAAAGTSRGWLGLGVRVLEVFGVDLKNMAAAKLGKALEDRALDGAPGLYRVSLEGASPDLKAVSGSLPGGATPLLVFLHGTASSTTGSFGGLWDKDNAAGTALRSRLAERYGERAYGLQHRSLTESPVENALALARALPAGAEVHLVSHSRGGLVGELLCLGMRDANTDPLDGKLIDTLFAADRTVAEQIGLSPLDTAAAKARDAAYDGDRKALKDLIAELDAKQLRITRFVRVACPARGTTLAAGRLDRWLSVMDFISGGGLFGEAVDFLLAVVKARTDPRTLPGVEAMMPGSALTRLLQSPDLSVTADLSVIAGDIEGDSLWQQIKLLATDWFYGADHDLVVNTGSMLGGLRRPDGGARYLRDAGGEVNHFRYFNNEKTVKWLGHGLTRPDGNDGGFLPIASAPHEAPRWREAVRRSRSGGTPRPLAVVLPGTMGSVLQQRGETVWLDYWRLLRGQLGRLRMGQPDVEPIDLIGDFYGPMVEFLARSHRVEIFPYDWRQSVTAAAARLAESLTQWLPELEASGQPVHLVAHSMGGLVVRAMIADGGAGTAAWQRITALPNSRFVMLGTPNLGSHEAVRWLTCTNPTQQKLALLDITQTTTGVTDIVREYAGLLELLPFDPAGADFADAARWKALKAELSAVWPLADATALREARKTWQRLLDAPPEPRHMIYLAGCQPATVVDYAVVPRNSWDPASDRTLAFEATSEGDGTVTWASGRLPGVPTWYIEDTAHDALCTQKRAFPGLLDLLMTGTTKRLPATPPQRSRAAATEPTRFPMPITPFTDDFPDEAAVRALGFGPGRPLAETQSTAAAPTLAVSIRHGDLAYARYPVLVGHYAGDTIVSAEAAVNQRLGGVLSQRLNLGMYPAANGTHALFFNEVPTHKPSGAIVVGLGLVGELSPGLLEAGVRGALLDFALQVAQWPDDVRFGPASAPRSAAVSCLLVGSGAGGMPVGTSVDAILRGAVSASAALVEQGLESRVVIDAVEIIEIFEDVAISAAEGLENCLRDGDLAGKLRWDSRDIQSGEGRRRRVRCDEMPDWWHRLEIVEEPGREALRFIFATDRARAEETLMAGQLELADAFIAQASASPAANSEIAKTLFEMLLPNSLKEMAPRQSNMVVMVDDRSARYPWELLENRWSAGDRPPAVAAGLVRQLKASQFRQQPAHAPHAKALVVGNPDLDAWAGFADLPGARQEAETVVAMLRSGGFEVRESIDERADSILAGLHRDAWRILHLAGHGVHEMTSDRGRTVSGMVIGRDAVLTPGDVEQMRWVPELVFINCCHLGKTARGEPARFNILAANLAVQFVKMGVKAVVAAGWAVDDAAANAFAASFYKHLLAGQPFGEAVRAAREEAWTSFPGINTWGAYQCYGDPSYRLRGQAGVSTPRAQRPFYAPSELVVALENHVQWVQMQVQRHGDDAEALADMRDGIAAILGRVPQSLSERWLGRADVAAALGFAWGETGAFAEAVDWLNRALGYDVGDCPVRAVEQCANFKVRLAGQAWAALRASSSADEVRRAELVTRIEEAISELDLICRRAPTEERYTLLGSACKRLAWLHAAEGPRLEALINMGNYYRLAMEAAGKGRSIYGFTNWALAEVLAITLGGAAGTSAAVLLEECEAMIEVARAKNAANPNFWDAASEADCALVRLIARAPSARVARRGADDVVELYRRALARGASPRQRATLHEHLDFLVALCEGARKPLRDAVTTIRAGL